MKKTLLALGMAALSAFAAHRALAWGAWGHNHINKGAVLALPQEMGMFFYNHCDFIMQESTVPDLRKYSFGDKEERPRHYVNLESYGYGSTPISHDIKEIMAKYGKDSMDKWGILPWYIQQMMDKLTVAMKNKRRTEILLLAADLGHYISDAHMPLHTTVNHDGELTGQKGIHAFWEAQLPELFGRDYKLMTAEAQYIKDVEGTTWALMDSTYRKVNKMLAVEKLLKDDHPADKQYEMGPDGRPQKNPFGAMIHSYTYSHVYHELLGGMVEEQMRKAIKLTADMWYTAWVNAGKPNLTELDPEEMTANSKNIYKADMKAWQKGKVRGCRSDKEFPELEP